MKHPVLRNAETLEAIGQGLKSAAPCMELCPKDVEPIHVFSLVDQFKPWASKERNWHEGDRSPKKSTENQKKASSLSLWMIVQLSAAKPGVDLVARSARVWLHAWNLRPHDRRPAEPTTSCNLAQHLAQNLRTLNSM